MSETHGGKIQLQTMLKELAVTRKGLKDRETVRDGTYEKLMETQEWINHEVAKGELQTVKNLIEEITGALREIGMEVALELKEKKPVDGLEIRKKTTFEILDEKEAVEYAKKNLPMTLTINKALFKKLVKAMPDEEIEKIDCVHISTDEYGEIRISADLGAYLREGAPF